MNNQMKRFIVKARSGRVLNTGASVPMELAGLTLPVSGCVQPTWKPPKPHTIGISWMFHHIVCVCACTQSCLILCNPLDYSPSGSYVHAILQARVLEQVAISFSRGSS